MQAIKDVLASVLTSLQNPEAVKRTALISEWSSIAGPKLAPHSRPTLSGRGELCVWVDQATLAFEVNQRYRQTLQKRVEAVLGDGTVKSVRVRVGQLR